MTFGTDCGQFKRTVLLAHCCERTRLHWLQVLDGAIGRSGIDVCRSFSGAEAVDRVVRGGLSAAVVVAEPRDVDGLSVLKMIRGVDRALPCWLVIETANRSMLQTAFSLRAASVFVSPFDPDELWVTVQRTVVN